jgi:hypothetical protein
VTCVLVAVLLTAAFSLKPSFAERSGRQTTPDRPNLGILGERRNADTIAIISGSPIATYLTIAYDLSDVVDDGDNFRVLPVVGKAGEARPAVPEISQLAGARAPMKIRARGQSAAAGAWK